MANQVITWTALPYAGKRGAKSGASKSGKIIYKSGTLKLSVHISPRLLPSSATTLAAFPDFMAADGSSDWPDKLKGLRFRVEVGTGKNPSASKIITPSFSVLDEALWSRLFAPSTPVRPFDEDESIDPDRLVSYKVRALSTLIEGQYKVVAKTPDLIYARPSVDKLVKASPALGALAATTYLDGFNTSALPPLIDRVPPNSITKMRLNVKTSSAVAAFNRFHQPLPTHFDAEPELPEFDFHTALSSLGNYPGLLRKLGLVVNIEIPESLVAGMSRIRVVPLWPSGVTPTNGHGSAVTSNDKSPWTRFTLDWRRTSASPFLPAPRATGAQIRDGEMIVRKPSANRPVPVAVLGYDVDMAAAKLKSLSQDVLVNLTMLGLADAQKRSTASAINPDTVEFAPRDINTGLPILRTTGPSIYINDTQGVFKSALARTEALNVLMENDDDGRTVVLDAEDVTQGWRVDVWDDNSGVWHKLCAREGTYSIGGTDVAWDDDKSTLVDEGWVEEGVIMEYGNAAKDKGTSDVKVHEQMFNWDGWSLVVGRPGKPILDSTGTDGSTTQFPDKNGYVTDEKGTYKIGQFVDPQFPLLTVFSVPRGSLPLLRYGTSYRFRVRAADMAGNSNPFKEVDNDFGRLGVTPATVHRRYEPIAPPVNLPKTVLGRGESVNEIVLRSTASSMSEASERHVVPPRVAQTIAEQHGGFDKVTTKIIDGKGVKVASPDPAAYAIIKEHEGDLPLVGPATAIESVPYLPEVIARGASLRGLPGVPAVKKGSDQSAGAGSPLVFSSTLVKSGTETLEFTVTRVSWQASTWHDPKPFVLRVVGIEATDERVATHVTPAAPSWDSATRTLTVQLAKAEKISVELSSYLGKEANVGKMALVEMGRSGLSAKSTVRGQISRSSMVGANWTITPSQRLTLTHAVEKPLLVPDAIFYNNRNPGETWAYFMTNQTLKVHGKSTGHIDVVAEWTDFIDDANRDPKTGDMPAFEYPVEPRVVFGVDVQPEDKSALNEINNDRARHFFGDTKRRKVKYHAVATSRFRDYFPVSAADDATRFTVAGKEYQADVPASARPEPPRVSYCIPSFQRVSATDSTQRLGGIRIYLERPWFSSGEGERLGVVFLEPFFFSGVMVNYLDFQSVRPWVSEWGHDPMWVSGTLPTDMLRGSSFPGATIESGLGLAEQYNPSGPDISVASFPVEFDPDLKLWFADVRLEVGSAYMPFVRLAVCRWQPWAISNLNNSPVVMCDFIQQVPDRSFTLAYSGTNVTINVSGPTYLAGSAINEAPSASPALGARWAFATIERRWGSGDLSWEAVEGNYVAPLRAPTPYLSSYPEGLLQGTIALPTREPGYEYRVQVREYEGFSAEENTKNTENRLLYVDTLPLWGGARL